MEVLDPDHDEPVAGERFQIPPPAVSDLVLAFDRIRRQDVRPAEAGAVREDGPDAHPRPEVGEEVAQPRRDEVQSDLLEVTRQDLPKWCVRSSLGTGTAARAKHAARRPESGDELGREARLALSRRAGHDREWALAPARALERSTQGLGLAFAADQRQFQGGRDLVHGQETPGVNPA